MARDTIGAGGQVTLPREILEAAQAKPGDAVAFEVTGPNTIVLRIHTEARPKRERGDDRRAPDTEPAAAPEATPIKYDELPILTLEEMLERYRIEGPVDLEADREAIYAEMAKDVFGERPDRFPT